MTSFDRVWAEMKERAKECARAGSVPRQSQAEILVASLMYAEHVDPPPSFEVIEFYAREFIAQVNEAAAERDAKLSL